MFKCGSDIVKVSRIEKLINEKEKSINKLFSEEEIKYCTVSNEKQKVLHFAGRFAAKEAIYKALSNTDILIKSWKDIEIISIGAKLSKPVVKIQGEINENIDVSISHEDEYAVAMAIYNY